MRSRGCAGGRRRAATPSAGEFRRFTEFYLVFFPVNNKKIALQLSSFKSHLGYINSLWICGPFYRSKSLFSKIVDLVLPSYLFSLLVSLFHVVY